MRFVRNKSFRTRIERIRRHPMDLPLICGLAIPGEHDSSHRGFDPRFSIVFLLLSITFYNGELTSRKENLLRHVV